MASHEMMPVKAAHVSVDESLQRGVGYVGTRTNETTGKATRVRRVFSFAQIFFFALSYMSSWEAVRLPFHLTCESKMLDLE